MLRKQTLGTGIILIPLCLFLSCGMSDEETDYFDEKGTTESGDDEYTVLSNSVSDPDPVVFVHGYSGSTIVNFSSMIKRFKNDGYSSDRLFYYKYISIRGVKKGADTLKKKVEKVLESTGKSKVDLVCHSMGGLVVRYYMKHLGGAGNVNQVVYVTTPHRGTAWAYLGLITQAARDMRPNSSLIKSINGYCPGLSLWSSCDEVVIPISSAKMGNEQNIGCWEHTASTHSANVYRLTRDYIN